MADAVNRIAPATVPLGHTDQRKRQRQEKNHGQAATDKPQAPATSTEPAEPAASELPETEKPKGRHININA
jgi:hypothetical protein